MPKFRNLTGQRFGRLRVIEFSHRKPKNHAAAWRCLCDCGAGAVVILSDLTSGKTRSCGCWRRENTGLINKTHGKSTTKAYNRWSTMIGRCSNPNHLSFPEYGGRGIRVCARWLDYSKFLHDMGEPPPKTVIDRIDNEGDYEPSNCRWADYVTSARNRRPQRIHPAIAIPIVCVETQQRFDNIKQAANWCMGSVTAVKRAAIRGWKSYGFHWRLE